MSDTEKPLANSDAEIEREILQRRKFSPEEAIGRMAGPGAMKGGSPISRQQQAENAVGVWLGANIADADGALRKVIHTHLKASKLLLDHVDNPTVAAAAYLRRTLASEQRLREIVREADCEWGRTMGERPHFEREGMPEHPDDPYTIDSVRVALNNALHRSPH